MKFVKFFPVLILFTIFGCNSEKDSPNPNYNDSTANARIMAGSSICELPTSNTDITDLAGVLSEHVNCLTPICEYPVPMGTTYDYKFAATSSYTPPKSFTPSDVDGITQTVIDLATINLSNVKNVCPSAIISGYTFEAEVYQFGQWQIFVTVHYACCNGRPID